MEVKLRRVLSDDQWIILLRCPGCGEWGEIDEDQLRGQVSTWHEEPDGCGYHETHDFASIGEWED